MFLTMQDKWIGLLHHVCNDHDWPGGSCDHGELPEDHSLPWFDRRAKDFEALQKIILDPALLESFKSITLNSGEHGVQLFIFLLYAGLSLRFQDAGYMLLVGKDLNSYEVLLGLFVC